MRRRCQTTASRDSPNLGLKAGVHGRTVERVSTAHPTRCLASLSPVPPPPTWRTGALTSRGSPLPSPVSRPPPPGGCPPGPCPKIGFIMASHHLESWVTNTAQAMVDPAFKPSPCQAGSKEQTPGSQQPLHSRVCSHWKSGGPLPRVNEGSRTLSSCPCSPQSPTILGKLNNIKGNSLPETARGNCKATHKSRNTINNNF